MHDTEKVGTSYDHVQKIIVIDVHLIYQTLIRKVKKKKTKQTNKQKTTTTTTAKSIFKSQKRAGGSHSRCVYIFLGSHARIFNTDYAKTCPFITSIYYVPK